MGDYFIHITLNQFLSMYDGTDQQKIQFTRWAEEKYRCQIIKQPYVILRHVSVVLKQQGPLKGIKEEENNNIYQFRKTQ